MRRTLHVGLKTSRPEQSRPQWRLIHEYTADTLSMIQISTQFFKSIICVPVCEDDSEEESLESDLGQVGNHAFARMEGDVDKQRKLILQGQMSEAAVQKQHQRK